MLTNDNRICEACGCIDEELVEVEVNGETREVCEACAQRLGYRQCDDCGEWVLESEEGYTTADGDFICESCYENDYVVCEDCGEIIRQDDAYFVHRQSSLHPWRTIEGYVCGDCFDDYTRCDDCGEYFPDSFIHSDYYHNICDNCFDDNWTVCEDCGAILRRDDAYYSERRDADLCESCYSDCDDNRDFHDYSYKPEPEFQFRTGELEKLKTLRNRYVSDYEAQESIRTFGVELEVDKGNDHDELTSELVELGQPIYMKHDGSLGDEGVEIVTHPCSLEYHMYELRWAEISRVCKANGYKSHDAVTCGLHIHVGRASLGADEDARDEVEAKLILLTSRFRQQLTNFSRRGEGELNHWASFAELSISEEMSEDELFTAAVDADKSTRYHAVNIQPRETVEFRLFRGTLKRDTLIASLQLVNNLVEYALTHTLKECAFKASWLDVINIEQFKELSTYAAQRGLL